MRRSKVIIAIGAILFLLGTGGNIMAERNPGSFTLTPFIGGYLFDSDQNLKHSPTYGLGFGYNLDKHWSAEAVFNYIDTESKAGAGDVNAYVYRLDGLYHFMPYGKVLPYLAAGIGGISLDPDRGGSDTDLLVNYGAGLKYFFNETMALRGDIRHIISFNDTNHNLVYTVGLAFLFGGEKKKVVPPPKDSDGDGVYDYLDKCPDTPAGVKVDARGCPLDSDNDGVYDYLDKCPDTPRGATVDQRGCWVLKGILFETAKWDIQAQAYPNLEEVVTILKRNPSLKVEIQGHTDNRGSKEYNERLSENRANAVMEYLVKKGVERYRLRAMGYGFSRPVASNDTPEGRALNRRVELNPIW